MFGKILEISDLTYSNGFPANLDFTNPIVVQLKTGKQGVVLYTCKVKNRQERSYLPLELNERFGEGLYWFGSFG